MAIGSVNNFLSASFLSPSQGIFNTSNINNNPLVRQMNDLNDQRNALRSGNQPQVNQTLFANLGRVGSAANSLRAQASAMSSLNQSSSSVGRTPSFTNDDVLSANVANNAVVSSHTRTNVTVDQVAAVQQNRGAALNANDNSFGDKFQLSITDNAGKTSTFAVDLSADATNRSAMQAMADRVNSANTSVRAQVVTNQENGTVSLQFTGRETGAEAGRFTVNDESAAATSNVTQESRSAEFSVNGVGRTSETNNVELMRGVNATLRETGTTQITYEPDMRGAVNSVKNFVNTFNELRIFPVQSRYSKLLRPVKSNSPVMSPPRTFKCIIRLLLISSDQRTLQLPGM